MGEGGTPLIRSKNIEKGMKLKFELYFKLESQNPTGSFKDRGSAIEVSKALEFRSKRGLCASTGNMGASLSAYSANAGLECFVFAPYDAMPVKIEQILACGARLFQTNGNFTQTERLVQEAFAKYKLFLLGDYQYRREGTKSLGFELAEQGKFDYVFSPIGNGSMIAAVWKAYWELKQLELLGKSPKLVGVQAEGCNPVVRAFKRGSSVKGIVNPRTIAVAIECGSPLDGERALKAMKESEGYGVSVSDNLIMNTRELLARKEGIFTEPAGAASLAGLLKARHKIEKKSKVVCVITGHGLKTPFTGIRGKLTKIETHPDVLKKVFG